MLWIKNIIIAYSQKKSKKCNLCHILVKKYIANDNSYCLNLSNPDGPDYRLAGTINEDPKEAEIVSEPYEFDIKSFKGEYRTHTFVNVKYNGDIIRILFDESCVDGNLEERITRNQENRLLCGAGFRDF